MNKKALVAALLIFTVAFSGCGETGMNEESSESEHVSVSIEESSEEESSETSSETVSEESEVFSEESSETSSETASEESTAPEEENEATPAGPLTVENCEEMADIFSNKEEFRPEYKTFAALHAGDEMEFDAFIADVQNHGDYTTRWDFLLMYGDYVDENTIGNGPYLQFQDVGRLELGYDGDGLHAGMNVHVIAKVQSYDENRGILVLTPVEVSDR